MAGLDTSHCGNHNHLPSSLQERNWSLDLILFAVAKCNLYWQPERWPQANYCSNLFPTHDENGISIIKSVFKPWQNWIHKRPGYCSRNHPSKQPCQKAQEKITRHQQSKLFIDVYRNRKTRPRNPMTTGPIFNTLEMPDIAKSTQSPWRYPRR